MRPSDGTHAASSVSWNPASLAVKSRRISSDTANVISATSSATILASRSEAMRETSASATAPKSGSRSVIVSRCPLISSLS